MDPNVVEKKNYIKQRDSPPSRIYKPLTELKYIYKSKSRPSTMDANASTELPLIRMKSALQSDSYLTNNYRYRATINDIFKKKIECGYIYDQISLIDLHMKEDTEKYKTSVLKHDNFVKSFELFLSRQYNRITSKLEELKHCEQETKCLNSTLNELKRTVVEKSLQVYDSERIWRTYKVSQKFLMHVAKLIDLKNKILHHTQIFNIDPESQTPSLDEIIKNFERHDDDQSFNATEFEHVTSEKLKEFLSELRNHNLKLLDLKLQREDLKNEILQKNLKTHEVVHDDKKLILENNEKLRHDIEDLEKKIRIMQTSIESEKFCLDNVEQLRKNIKILYKRCFGSDPIKESHLQMVRNIEEHCLMLLNKLNTFSPQILNKVIKIKNT